MNYFQALLLAIVEGLTEFLPVSSTGHLILTAHLLGIGDNEFVKSFEIIIQLGAILAVAVLYFKTLTKNIALWKTILVAFFPSMIIGLLLYKIVKTVFLGNPYITLVTLFLGGIAIILLEKKYKSLQSHTHTVQGISLRQALFIGICQSISVVPGVSRAASTILGGMYTGLTRETAVEFSFLLAFPTMLAASTLDVVETKSLLGGGNFSILIFGFVIAFVTAYASMRWLLGFVKTHTFTPFGVYRIALSLLYYILVLR
jgi:undecaprenyl-diphosphatase